MARSWNRYIDLRFDAQSRVLRGRLRFIDDPKNPRAEDITYEPFLITTASGAARDQYEAFFENGDVIATGQTRRTASGEPYTLFEFVEPLDIAPMWLLALPPYQRQSYDCIILIDPVFLSEKNHARESSLAAPAPPDAAYQTPHHLLGTGAVAWSEIDKPPICEKGKILVPFDVRSLFEGTRPSLKQRAATFDKR